MNDNFVVSYYTLSVCAMCISQPMKLLHDTVVAHGMSVRQLKQAILDELTEKQVKGKGKGKGTGKGSV